MNKKKEIVKVVSSLISRVESTVEVKKHRFSYELSSEEKGILLLLDITNTEVQIEINGYNKFLFFDENSIEHIKKAVIAVLSGEYKIINYCSFKGNIIYRGIKFKLPELIKESEKVAVSWFSRWTKIRQIHTFSGINILRSENDHD